MNEKSMSIYDCFTFYNEIELLELRLETLSCVVDKFVIVELNRTHRNLPKPYNFKLNEEKFSKYMDKIIYIQPEDIPVYQGDGDRSIENFQRNCIVRALNICKPNDTIIISDIDEIPDPNIFLNSNSYKLSLFSPTGIKFLIRQILRIFFISPSLLFRINNFNQLLDHTAIVCEQNLFYYYLNCKSKGKWYGSVISKYKNIQTIQKLRDLRMMLPCVKNAGWHFSYLGGVEKIKIKLNSIIDENEVIIEKMKKCALDDKYIETCLAKGIDLYGRKGDEFEYEFIKKDEIGLSHIDDFIKNYPEFYKK